MKEIVYEELRMCQSVLVLKEENDFLSGDQGGRFFISDWVSNTSEQKYAIISCPAHDEDWNEIPFVEENYLSFALKREEVEALFYLADITMIEWEDEMNKKYKLK